MSGFTSVLKDLCRPSHAPGALLPPGSHTHLTKTCPLGPPFWDPIPHWSGARLVATSLTVTAGLQRTAAPRSLRMEVLSLSIDSQARERGVWSALPDVGSGSPASDAASFPASIRLHFTRAATKFMFSVPVKN